VVSVVSRRQRYNFFFIYKKNFSKNEKKLSFINKKIEDRWDRWDRGDRGDRRDRRDRREKICFRVWFYVFVNRY
jgi:hypothetical protein